MSDGRKVGGSGLDYSPSYGLQEGAGEVHNEETILREIEPSKISDPDTQAKPPKPQYPKPGHQKAESFLQGYLLQSQLNAKPYKPPATSRDLVNRHTGTDGKLDVGNLADEMARMANSGLSQSPLLDIYDKVPKGQRADVAREFVKRMGDAGMRKIAITAEGRMLLNATAEQLRQGPKVDYNELKPIYAAVQKGIVDEHVNTLGKDPDFTKLKPAERENVIKDLSNFAATNGYKQITSDSEKARALNVISTLSIHAAANPKITTARNTLNQFVNGSLRMEFYNENSRSYAQALVYPPNDRVVSFNTHPKLPKDKEALITSTAHEVNHLLNPLTQPGTKERFLSEYRAFYMERSAMGENPPKVDYLIATLKNLAASAPNGDGYDALRNLYLKDNDFSQIVDTMLKDLSAKPPKITTPEQLRLKFQALKGGNQSLPLTQPSNMDNR